VIAPQGIHYRAKLAGYIAQPKKPLPAIYAYQYRNGGGVCRVRGFRHKYRPDLIRGIGGKPFQSFLPLAEGRTLYGQFQPASLYDCPGFYKGRFVVAAHARGKPICQTHYLAFQFRIFHFNTSVISLYLKYYSIL
jgi:hypothetical protein